MRTYGGLAEGPPTTTEAVLRGSGLSAWGCGIALAVAALAGVVGAPIAWLVAAVAAAGLALGRGGRSFVSMLPVGAVLLIATTLIVPLAAGTFGADVLQPAASTRVMLVFAAVATAAWAWYLGAEEKIRPNQSGIELALAAAPSTLMLGLLAVVGTTGSSRLSWFLSGDHLRHVGLTTRTLDAGALEYGLLSYPHGWHALMATMWASSGESRNGAGLRALIELQAVATWSVLTLLPLALGFTATTLARARGLGPRHAGVAGLLAGSLVLGPAFFGDYVPRGFDTTLLVLLVVAAAVHVVAVAPDSSLALAAAVSATVVTAHSWQVLLVPAGLLTALVLWHRRRRRERERTTYINDILTVGLGALASFPGVAAAVGGFGVKGAAESGDVPPPVIGWFVAAVVAAALVARRGGRGPVTVVVVTCAAAFLTSGLLAMLAGVGLASYYPSKTLWVAAALGLPALGCLVALALSGIDGESAVARARYVSLGTLIGLSVAVSAATPTLGVLRGAWGGANTDTVMRVVTSEAAADAVVIWRVSDETDDATSQLLLDFYTATAHTPRLGLAPRTAVEQCALLRQAREAVVLSEAPESEVRSRFGCVPGLRVVRVSGAS